MKSSIALLALALGACAEMPDTSHDYYGNVFPADCPASLTSESAQQRVVRVENRTLTLHEDPQIVEDSSVTYFLRFLGFCLFGGLAVFSLARLVRGR